MPDVAQYTFNLREVAETLVRNSDIKTGKWQIGLSFNFGVGNMGQSPAEAKPGVMLTIENITLVKVEDGVEAATGLVVDAAAVAGREKGKKS